MRIHAFIVFIILSIPYTSYGQNHSITLVEKDVTFDLHTEVPNINELFFGWRLIDFSEWYDSPAGEPLFFYQGESGLREHTEVFEARAAYTIPVPVTAMTEEFLLDPQLIEILNPFGQHEFYKLDDQPLSLTTLLDFPPTWKRIINMAKNTGFLGEDKEDHLLLGSSFVYANKETIKSLPEVQDMIKRVSIFSQEPEALCMQNITYFNQIGQFGVIFSLFYPQDKGQSTLVVTYVALGLKGSTLDMGMNLGLEIFTFTGRSILMGQHPLINSNEGISAGLPVFTKQLMFSAMQALPQAANASGALAD